jgi:hypothetical protein
MGRLFLLLVIFGVLAIKLPAEESVGSRLCHKDASNSLVILSVVHQSFGKTETTGTLFKHLENRLQNWGCSVIKKDIMHPEADGRYFQEFAADSADYLIHVYIDGQPANCNRQQKSATARSLVSVYSMPSGNLLWQRDIDRQFAQSTSSLEEALRKAYERSHVPIDQELKLVFTSDSW